jgi:hypothetical protein
MRAKSRNAVGLLCVVLIAGVASEASAQQAPSLEQTNEQLRRDIDPWRRSRLVSAGDSLAIDWPGQEPPSVAPSAGCAPPLSRSGVIQVDCAGLNDGIVYYFDEATRSMIGLCDSWRADPRRCPPPQWPTDVPGCDGTVPPSIGGTWRFYALPGADGFYPLVGGWTMTLREGSMLFDFTGLARIVRSYTSVAAGDGRHTLEIKDARSATTAINVQLAQCGMVVDGAGVCDAFCRNVAGEFGIPNLPRQLEPLFPARAFFRTVTPGD